MLLPIFTDESFDCSFFNLTPLEFMKAEIRISFFIIF